MLDSRIVLTCHESIVANPRYLFDPTGKVDCVRMGVSPLSLSLCTVTALELRLEPEDVRLK